MGVDRTIAENQRCEVSDTLWIDDGKGSVSDREISALSLLSVDASWDEKPRQMIGLSAKHQLAYPGATLSEANGMALRLRQACVTDLPGIYRGEESYIRCWESEHETRWRSQLERHLTRWVENFDRLTVAVIDEHFAGYSLWMREAGYAELCTINVGQHYRRNGIGTKLLDSYAVAAARQGFTHLRLSVRPDNPAKLMYEKAGFVCIGTGAGGYLTYERLA